MTNPIKTLLDYRSTHGVWGEAPTIAVVGWNTTLNERIVPDILRLFWDKSLGAPVVHAKSQWDVPYSTTGRITAINHRPELDNGLAYWSYAGHVAGKYLTLMNSSHVQEEIGSPPIWVIANSPNPSYVIDYSARQAVIPMLKSDKGIDDIYQQILDSGIVMGTIIPQAYLQTAFRSPIMDMLKPMITVILDSDVENLGKIDNDGVPIVSGEFEHSYRQMLAHYWRCYAAEAHSTSLAEAVIELPFEVSKPLGSFASKKKNLWYVSLPKTTADRKRVLAQTIDEITKALPSICAKSLGMVIQHKTAMEKEINEEDSDSRVIN